MIGIFPKTLKKKLDGGFEIFSKIEKLELLKTVSCQKLKKLEVVKIKIYHHEASEAKFIQLKKNPTNKE